MPKSFVMLASLALALAAAAAPANAQVEFGIKGGASFGNISNKGVLPGNLKTRTGWAAGVSLGLRARVLGVGAEALYARRGLKSDGTGDLKLDYVDIPVYAKVQAPTDRKSTRLNSSHMSISYAVFCLKKKKKQQTQKSSV